MADNPRRYSAREFWQMDKAAQLAQRLGHATSKAVIYISNSDVMNYLVYATEVRNKDATNGVFIAGILGKLQKRSQFPRAMCLPLKSRNCNKSSALTSYSLRKSPFFSAYSFLLG